MSALVQSITQSRQLEFFAEKDDLVEKIISLTKSAGPLLPGEPVAGIVFQGHWIISGCRVRSSSDGRGWGTAVDPRETRLALESACSMSFKGIQHFFTFYSQDGSLIAAVAWNVWYDPRS